MLVSYQCLLAAALAATVVNGHGYMTEPACKFTASAGDPTQFIATIEASASGLSGTFNGAPSDNVAAFTKAFGSSSYKSLKDFIDAKAKVTVSGATLTCGSCDPKQTPQPLPATVEWSHSDTEGFTPSHEGPCEVWCDDKRAFQDDDCAAHYKSAPAELPYEKASCSGASQLTFYWMAMHSSTWQVYVNCAPLSGGSGGSTTANSTSSTTTEAPSTATTDAPTVTSEPTTPSATTAPSTTTSSSAGSLTGSSTGSTPSTSTGSSSASTPAVTSAPSTGSTASTTSPPSTSSGEASDCGSYDVAGSESDCGSYDVAGSESDCGSYDVAGSESDCGSYDVAGSGTDTSTGTTTQGSATGGTTTQGSSTGGGNQYYSGTWGNTNQGSNTQTTQQYTGSKTNIDFNTVQSQNWNAGTVAPK